VTMNGGSGHLEITGSHVELGKVSFATGRASPTRWGCIVTRGAGIRERRVVRELGDARPGPTADSQYTGSHKVTDSATAS